MYLVVEIRINVRTTADIKRDIEIAARLRGMTVSSLINSLAVKTIREEKMAEPEAFLAAKREHYTNSKSKPKHLAAVVARIEPASGMTKDEIRRSLDGDRLDKRKTG